MVVRRAVEADSTKLEELLCSFGESSRTKVAREELRAENLYVAAVGSYAVAGALAIDASQDERWTVSVVHGLVVRPCCERWGVARFLMQFAEGWARRAGSEVLRMVVRAGNVAEVRLCGALGYRAVDPAPLKQGVVTCFEKKLP